MKVLIIGGGVGGPVLALALARAGLDAEVEVVEARTPSEVEEGSWITFQANGMDALRAIDAAGPLEEQGYPVETISFVNGRGRSLGSMPLAASRPDRLTSRMLARRTLAGGIGQLARDRGITLTHGVRFVSARYEGSQVVATFNDGSERRADLLVGADGIWSRVRTFIDPSAARPRYVPVLNVGGHLPGFRVDVPQGEFRMQFGTRCFFAWMPTPDGGTVWFANPPHPGEPERGSLERISDASWRSTLHTLMAQDHGPAHDIIDAAPEPLRAWATYDLPTVRRWHDSRAAVLLGDAAHAVAPSAGQGASMALEDAVTLARCLRDAPGATDSARIAAALPRYEALRRARTEKIVAYGHRSSNSKAAGPLGRVVRDAILPLMFARAARDGGKSMMWLQGHHVEFDAPVEF
ncbi:FAD-dependent oxidoreductase [Frondihabitans australicus]|uniref:2-polyprenyl-6-methoxyphenol hydroxylase-like FAD-dependent oxidoreductase n=1 Tax=Frondihabitans australicus TaxID=386892 RepID=A0A495IDF7_9MICO|nr:NAD(P)/FAD-dependent oxidoreductase [Frondihabitans australicus]RKR73498.1 2-polyprenyl-6-methoxyphenol hydroxylase-like FAD-dependent oxidoreductase [Frondihabitans australicus]